MITTREDMIGLDTQILLHPETWVASGHVNAFNDPLVEDKVTHKRYRADHLIEAWLEKHPLDEEIVVEGMDLEAIGAFIEKHVIVGDSNMAESSFVLKVGSTLMVLAMIETGWPLPEFDLANEIASIREIAEDITGQTAVPMKTGAKKTAIAIQREYLECAKSWLASHDDPNNEFQQVLLLWEKTVHAIETQNLAALARDIDWVIKLQLLRNFQHKLGVSDFQHPKLAQIDLAYHDIRPGRGLFLHLESKKLVNRWIDQTHITRAIDYPPDTTRAKLRGEFIAKAVEYGAPFSVDWVRLKIARPQPQVVELLDPFATKSLEVGALMEYMATHADSFREHP